jgi:predicted MPP superfamily phosphohydrolase
MRCAWATDIHLNFVEARHRYSFAESVLAHDPDIVLLGGDLAEADTVVPYLQELEGWIKKPIYFVLGNHDFYRGSIRSVRESISELTRKSDRLSWLNNAGVVSIGEETSLVGHDSWADGGLGDYWASGVVLNDFLLIEEFLPLGKPERLKLLEMLAEEAATHFATVLPQAFNNSRSVVLLTHVPPFRQACWHEGKISADDFLPYFASKVVGDVLISVMEAHPDCNLRVFCGHTHGGGAADILPNLKVYTGGAEYRNPRVQMVFEVT